MNKMIRFDSKEMRKDVFNAISDMAKMVGATLGPAGRPILIEREGKPPIVTKDGVTVSEHYQVGGLAGIVTNAAKEVCERSAKQTGDGTSTAIVLASAMVEAGQEYLAANPKVSPQFFSRELWATYENEIKPRLLKMTRPISGLPEDESKQAIRHVALVSANHDESIADAVVEATSLVGEDGIIAIEEGAGATIRVEHKEGFPISSGLHKLGGAAGLSFVNRQAQGDCVLDASYVCLYDGEINDVTVIVPLLEKVAVDPEKSPMVIVAHAFSDQVLKAFAQNFRRGTLIVVPLITPRNGQEYGRSEILHDLASYVGGKVLDSQGSPLPLADIADLGFVDSVKITDQDAIFLGESEIDLVEKRIKDLKERMENMSEFDCGKIKFRIGRLTGGVATIYSGGATALEAQERRDRGVDAVSAVRCALDMGVIAGGGAPLYTIAQELESLGTGSAKVLAKALRTPIYLILENAGMLELDTLDVGEKDGKFMVYDAAKHIYREYWESGILDPVKVTLSSVENALSVAQLLITLGGVIGEDNSESVSQVREMQKGLAKIMEEGV